jgi:hypothetical protein
MKRYQKTVFSVAFLFTVLACGAPSNEHHVHDHDASDDVAEGGNQALYDQVMAVHDEVMPKMNDIYKLKESLTNKIAEAPTMPAAEKEAIAGTISKLDSASESMMVWMRNFNPLPDSLGEQEAKEYLENEMEKVQRVRTNILEALEEGKGI